MRFSNPQENLKTSDSYFNKSQRPQPTLPQNVMSALLRPPALDYQKVRPLAPKRMSHAKSFDLFHQLPIQRRRCLSRTTLSIIATSANPKRLARPLQTLSLFLHQFYRFPEIRSWVFLRLRWQSSAGR